MTQQKNFEYHRRPIRRCQQRGSFSAFMVILIVSLTGMSGLVFDGGRVISAYLEISDDAQNAARLGTQNLISIRAGSPEIHPAQAHEDMSEFLQQRGHDALVFVSSSSITVEIRRRVPMRVLNMFGVSSRTINVRRTVEAVAQ